MKILLAAFSLATAVAVTGCSSATQNAAADNAPGDPATTTCPATGGHIDNSQACTFSTTGQPFTSFTVANMTGIVTVAAVNNTCVMTWSGGKTSAIAAGQAWEHLFIPTIFPVLTARDCQFSFSNS